MFVKSIPKWKIKRFFKRIFKAFIFFSILFSLTFSSFAKSKNLFEFADFETFVTQDGSVSYLLRNESSSIVQSGEFFADNHNLNTLVLANHISSSFTSARITINDSSNVMQSFSGGETLVLKHHMYVMIDGQTQSTYDDLFTVTITYETDDFKTGSFEYRGDDVLGSPSRLIYDSTNNNSRLQYNVDLVTTLPSFSGKILSISYHFYNIASESYFIMVCPSAKMYGVQDSLYYYVGDNESAPIYPEYDTSTPELDDAVDEFDKADADATEIFNNSNDSFFNFIDSAIDGIGTFLYPVITAVSSIITFVLTSLPEPIQHLFAFALILGMLAFVMGLVNTVISRWRSS